MNHRKIFQHGMFFLILFMIPVFSLVGQDLTIDREDLRIEMRADGGFHLYIRKKPSISSVLITESTRDPTMNSDNFAYRAREYNPINGDEIRLLDGRPIPVEMGQFYLISSSLVSHPELGPAFHIYIPWVLDYGLANTRRGTVHVGDGTYFNIRAFTLPYGDYRGDFADNPFILQAVQPPEETIPEGYMGEAVDAFREIALHGGGDFTWAADPAEMVAKIEELLLKEAGNSLDIVICLDTTGSMQPYINALRRMLITMMRNIIAEFTDWRIGMVLFRDYPPDLYLTRIIPFTKDFELFQRNLNAAQAQGGGDIPEAVYEALYDGADKFPWEAESRLLILIGDAPPHPTPRGSITSQMVDDLVEEKDLKVSVILLPSTPVRTVR